MNKLIILLGQRVRSGTNFVGSTLAQHPEVVTLPKENSVGEFNLFYEATIEQIFKKVRSSSFGMEFNEEDRVKFLKNYGVAWLKLLIDKYKVPIDKTIFVKSPSVEHIELWKAAFPDSKIAVICRDGRDNVISSVRASNDKRTWHNLITKFKKRYNYSSGRSFINHTKHWQKTAQQVMDLATCNRVKIFKYEDLNNSEVYISELLEHYNLDISDAIIKQCLAAPVVGSSFGIDTKTMSKPNWTPEVDKTKFKFSNKWKHWGFLKKMIFKTIAGKMLIVLNYEESTNW